MDGTHYLNMEIINKLNISDVYIWDEIIAIKEKLRKRAEECKIALPQSSRILLVDDGIATGYTVLASIKMLKNKNNEVYVACPVISFEAYEELLKECDGIYAVLIDKEFVAVGYYYDDFSDVDEDYIVDLFKRYVEKGTSV
jgi:putative phosphoribosyl transferase